MSDQERVESTASAELVSFVPRLTLDWLRDQPDTRWREVDGTLAFIDISGFTAMSERLSSLGRAGAEEVTEVMNATFAALLAVAYAQGGGLLKFGGDALLLLYEGGDHAARAARAAFEMRRTLARDRPPEDVRRRNPAEDARGTALRHASSSSWSATRTVSSSIAGPAASRTVEMEATSRGRRDPAERRSRRAPRAGRRAQRGEGPRPTPRAAPGVRGRSSRSPPSTESRSRVAVPASAPRPAARGGAAGGRAPERGHRLRPIHGDGRDHRDRGPRSRSRDTRSARPHRPGARPRRTR